MNTERTIQEAFKEPYEKTYAKAVGELLSPFQRFQENKYGNVLPEHSSTDKQIENDYYGEREAQERRINEQFERQQNDQWGY